MQDVKQDKETFMWLYHNVIKCFGGFDDEAGLLYEILQNNFDNINWNEVRELIHKHLPWYKWQGEI